MARGNRRGIIVRDDADRGTFLRTLGEACERTGFRIHAYVLMGNHYHLLLETPKANLSRGMGWFQNAFTRRINTRHALGGHLFGGRYKAILVEPGNCFSAILDYIHLNPVRAGLTKESDGLESYPWSSLPGYLQGSRKRAPWLETETGLGVCGCSDTAKERKEFLRVLESRVDWQKPREAGTAFPEAGGRTRLSVHSSLRRGWLFGSQEFREGLVKLMKRREIQIEKANGYHGPQLTDHSEERAVRLLAAGLEYYKVDIKTLRSAKKGDQRKGLLAALIQSETTIPQSGTNRHWRSGILS